MAVAQSRIVSIVGAEQTGHGLRLDEFQMLAIAIGQSLGVVSPQLTHMLEPSRGFHPAAFVVAVDRILGDTLANDIVAAVANLFEHVAASFAQLPLNSGLATQSCDHLPTVAARRTPAKFVCFQQHNGVAAFRHGQGGGNA